MHARVDRVERARRRLGRRAVAVDDAEHGVHRSARGAERVREEIAVVGDARRYQRMRELEEERALPAQEQHCFAVYAAEDTVAGEEAVGVIHLLA
jgi:hypothetical protein